jgi:hypothetical protein
LEKKYKILVDINKGLIEQLKCHEQKNNVLIRQQLLIYDLSLYINYNYYTDIIQIAIDYIFYIIERYFFKFMSFHYYLRYFFLIDLFKKPAL